MNTLARLVCLLAIAAGATASQVAAAAGDPVNGAMLYSATCAQCHALPPVKVVLKAADPAFLQNAIASVPEMSAQPKLLALTLSQITDISAYIASFVVGAPANYQGIWWNAGESGWGINLAHQGDTVFASWFTYDTAGKGWWLVMTALKTGAGVYTGDLYQTSGSRFDAFDTTKIVATKAGTGTLTFTDANNGTFAYVVGGVSQVKVITRQVFGTLPTCSYGTQPNLALATNYQDLWWAKPAASESGWGINFNHESNTIFATWFTYDIDGSSLWLVVTALKTAPGVYTGDLYRTSGARFDAFDTTKVVPVKVGTATFTFSDGNTASFMYTVQVAGMAAPVTQTKAITRELFSTSGTTCQ